MTASDPEHVNRRWLRAVWMDSILSFASVLIFTAIFTACGAVVLGPRHEIPSGTDLLTLQAQFVTPLFPWLKHLYFAGAFLAIFGTLYGTIEVAPAVLREFVRALYPAKAPTAKLRRISVLWVGIGGFLVLLASLLYTWFGVARTPPGLIAVLTPTNLFTGVLACGLICWLAVWSDQKHLPAALRMNPLLTLLVLVAGLVFVGLGLKGYWDNGGTVAWLILFGTLGAGWGTAFIVERYSQK